MKRIFPRQTVVASPRGSKNTDLLNGKYDGIQAYTTTEIPALRRFMKEKGWNHKDLVATPLEGATGGANDGKTVAQEDIRLGYSQMLFLPDECLSHPDRREASRAFLDATFRGWDMAIRNPEEAIRAVSEAQKMLGLDDEGNDHWHPSGDFHREMLDSCCDHVKETFGGDRLGVLEEKRWGEAVKWLLAEKEGSGENVNPKFGLDPTGLWKPVS